MKNRHLAAWILAVALLSAGSVIAAGTPNFTGEYVDRKFLNGQAVFQMSLEQSGNTVSVFFSAVHNNGQGAAPEADTTGHVTSKGAVEFQFQDSLGNAGTGTITRAGDDVLVSIKVARVADPRCLAFYKQGMRLTRVAKK